MKYRKKYPYISSRRKRRQHLPLIRIVFFLVLILGTYQFLKDDDDQSLVANGKEIASAQAVLPITSPTPNAIPALSDSELALSPEEYPVDAEESEETEPETVSGDSTAPAPPPPSATDSAGKETFEEKSYMARQADPRLAQSLLKVLKSQNPYGGFYLVADGETGRILAWAEHKGYKPLSEPSFLKSSDFPAASLSKIITAAAALESGKYSLYTEIPSIGRTVTLYQKQLKVSPNYKGNMVSLEKAFASSMNPPMGIIGQHLGGSALRSIAERFGFNADFPNQIPQKSVYNPPETGFAVAEAASGYTTEVTLSPLLAGAMVRSVLTGKSPELLWSREIGTEYAPTAPVRIQTSPFKEQTYESLQQMFEATVVVGSARKAFRDVRLISSSNRKKLRVGGKTGTKDRGGYNYQWFAGFAEDRNNPKKSLVIICLHMNQLTKARANPPSKAAAMVVNQWAAENVK